MLQIYGVPAPVEVLPDASRLQGNSPLRFVADGHLGKLARNLRLLGLDTVYERDADDLRLLEIMVAQDRVLLTRDRPLLMHSIVRHGYCPAPMNQKNKPARCWAALDWAWRRGVGPLFALPALQWTCWKRWTRSEVLAPLAAEPLTLRYYDDFRRCPGCRRIYWPGTHTQKLAALVTRLLDES